MKQDISIITQQERSAAAVSELLLQHEIKVLHFNNVRDAMVGLALHSLTFLLLDFTIDEAASFFTALFNHFSQPHPYTIVSANYPNGRARAAMFRKGADACVDNPMIAEEILAVIEAALRRGQQDAGPSGKSCSCIEYKDLQIDSLRRSVTMRGELVALTAKEFDVLHFLASHVGSVLTKEEIYSAVTMPRLGGRSFFCSYRAILANAAAFGVELFRKGFDVD